MRNKLMKKNEQTGFTIIEVVLVLAIAGLIFLIVFLALPQLQKSRRDTQRKSDAGRWMAAAENYAGNNNGDYPATGASGFATIRDNYLVNGGGVFRDPSQVSPANYFHAIVDGTNPDQIGEMRYQTGTICSNQLATTTGATPRNITVIVYQESGGTFCQDNQ